MSDKAGSQLWRVLLLLGGLIWLLSLWPTADSLYGLTGEEDWRAQLRGVIHWLNTAVRPQPHLAPNAVNAYADVSPFGINTFLQLEVEPEKRRRSLQLIDEAGFNYIRQEFTWEDIEIHGKGDFVDRRNDPDGVSAWAKYDNIVDLTRQYEVEVIARLSNPPSWSRALPDEVVGAHGPPDDFDDYGDFAAAVADRYRGQVTYFQLWNEPNIYPEWGEQNVDPEAYTDLLCLGYRRIKEVNAEAVILSGAMAPTVAMDGRNMNDLIFLQRMYNAGAGDCFDILSAQGYGLWSGAGDQRLRPTVVNYPHHMLLRDVMVHNGDAHKPIWISEMGWNTVPQEMEARYGRVSQEQQARYGVEAYRRVQTEWPWIGVVNYWFFKRPGDSERDEPWYYFRLMEPDFTPLPAFQALSAYANEPQEPEPMPGWVYGWMRLRPWLFRISSAVLFLALLHFLAPKSERAGA
jgi:hypothetical protein